MDDLYIGIECGLNDVLEKLNKGYSADDTREQCLRLNAAGIGHCDLLMLGTAGKGRGLDLPDCYFWALHPLDSVKIDGILQEEKQQMLDALTWSIEHVNESRINRSSRVGTL